MENKKCCCGSSKPKITKIDTFLTNADYWDQILARISNKFRSNYKIEPGLYSIGNPDKKSSVMVTANYKLTFNALRRELKNIDAWILVLDTKGINVWCAAGKGTFSTKELLERMIAVQLNDVVEHRKIILPQLGAVGVEAHVVQKCTGFRVIYGPVYAKDIPTFLAENFKVTPQMRKVHFTLFERFELTPLEINLALKKSWIFVLITLLIFGLEKEGIMFKQAFEQGTVYLLLGFTSVFAGAFLTPVLLPFIPGRSFAIKGLFTGIIPVVLIHQFWKFPIMENIFISISIYMIFPVISSFLALNFTGCTPITSVSGVKKEMKYAIPTYVIVCALTIVCLVIYKIQEWGLL